VSNLPHLGRRTVPLILHLKMLVRLTPRGFKPWQRAAAPQMNYEMNGAKHDHVLRSPTNWESDILGPSASLRPFGPQLHCGKAMSVAERMHHPFDRLAATCLLLSRGLLIFMPDGSCPRVRSSLGPPTESPLRVITHAILCLDYASPRLGVAQVCRDCDVSSCPAHNV
jgi:hypothetical protein